MPEERRRYPRVNIVVVYVFEGKEYRTNASLIKNISTHGACLIIDVNIALRTKVSLTIHLPDQSEPFTVQGEVVWGEKLSFGLDSDNNDFSVGVKFVNMTEQARERLAKFVEGFSPSQGN